MSEVAGVWSLSIHGSTRLHSPTEEIKLRPRERSVLAALALGHPESLSLIRIAELVWGIDIPRTYNKSIHNHISRIRQAAEGVIETSDDGYRLHEQVVLDRSRPGTTATVPFAELADGADVHEYRARERFLAQQTEDSILVELVEQGCTETTIGALRSAVAVAPQNEIRWRLLVQALAQTGQRRRALVALDDAQKAFSTAGLDFGTELRDLERRVADDDVTLRGPVRLADPATPAAEEPTSATPRTIRLDDHRKRILPLLRAATGTSTIALTGPAGIGKTTMATTIRELANTESFSVYWATCSTEPTVAFEPFADLLQQIAIRHPDELRRGPGADLLSGFVPELIADSTTKQMADRRALFDAISSALRSDPRPTVMVIEDLHWASPFTIQLLQHCQRHTHEADAPLVFVCTSRVTVEHAPESTNFIEVQSWTADETAAYLALVDPAGASDDGRADWIHRQTGGVALHVRELTLAVLHDPRPPDGGLGSATALPPSLIAHLDTKRRELSHSAQRVLAAAAVLGKVFTTAVLEKMIIDVAGPLEEAIRADIVLPVHGTDRHQFRHDLLHYVTLNAVSPGTLVELHDLAVRALESWPAAPAGELARHALASATVDRTRAVSHLNAAAELATEQYAFEEAITAYINARDLLPVESVRWCEATIAAGRIMARTGDERAQSFLRTAAEAATGTNDQDLAARSILELCRLGLTSTVGEVDERAEQLLHNALELTIDPGPRSMVGTAAVGLYLLAGRPQTVRRHYLHAIDNAEQCGDPLVLSDALGVTALALVEADDMPRRIDAAARLEAIGRERDSPAILFGGIHLRMSNEVQRGDPDMRQTLEELEQLAAVLRQRSRDWEVTNWRATVALIDGDLDLSEAHATEALQYVDAIAPSAVTSAYGAALLGIRVAAGRAGELVDLLRSTLEEQPTFGAWHAALSLAAASAGDTDLANTHLDILTADDCAVLERDFTFSTALSLAGDAAHLTGHADAAKTLTAHLAPWSGAWAWMGTATLGPVDLSLARLAALTGDQAEARSLGRAALDQAEMAKAPIHRAAATALLDTLST